MNYPATQHELTPATLTVDLNRFASRLVGIALFVLYSTPSIKLFLYKEAINVVPVVLLLGATVLRAPARVSAHRILVLATGLALFAMLFGYGAYDSTSLDLVAVLKYVILCFLCIALSITVDRQAMRTAAVLIALWGIPLSVLQLSEGITLDQARGQNYLTMGYALGSSTLIGLIAASAARSRIVKLGALACALLSLAAAVTLLGRGPVLFPIAIAFAYFGLNTILDPRPGKFIVRGGLCLLALIPIVYYIHVLLETQGLIERLLRLTDVTNEPRMVETYIPALQAIARQPLGYGLDAHWRLLGAYPHNIFLEIALSAGLLALALFVCIVLLFARRVSAAARDRTDIGVKCIFFLTLFYLAVWNVSFDLSSAYALLPSVLMFAALDLLEFRLLAAGRRLEVRTDARTALGLASAAPRAS